MQAFWVTVSWRALGPQLRKPLDTERVMQIISKHTGTLLRCRSVFFQPLHLLPRTQALTQGKTPAGPHVDENGFLKQI